MSCKSYPFVCGPHLELLGSHTQYACGGKGHHMAPLFVTQASDAGEPRSWCAPVHIVPLQNGSMPPCCTCHRTDALLDVAGVLFREKTREGKRRRTEKKKMPVAGAHLSAKLDATRHFSHWNLQHSQMQIWLSRTFRPFSAVFFHSLRDQ